jgi:hypothetical protein
MDCALYADGLVAQARPHGRVRQERPAFRSRLQTPLPEFAVEEAEIANALRAIDPGADRSAGPTRRASASGARAELWFRE